jgi:hypothetical protein
MKNGDAGGTLQVSSSNAVLPPIFKTMKKVENN